jgi:hypothetical protein
VDSFRSFDWGDNGYGQGGRCADRVEKGSRWDGSVAGGDQVLGCGEEEQCGRERE